MSYEVIKHLGSGLHGCVYLVKNRNGKKYIAKLVFKNGHIYKSIFEPAFLRKCKHPNIVNIHEILHLENGYVIIEELANGDMMKWRSETCTEILITELKHLKRAMIDILRAIDYLHKCNIIHCDIKPNNFLMFSPDNVLSEDSITLSTFKLCDFSVSKINIDKKYKGKICNSYYRPPEVWLREEYDEKIDIWCLGCSFYELLTGDTIFKFTDGNVDEARNFFNTNSKIIIDKRLFSIFDVKYRQDLMFFSRIIESMLITDPSVRPSAEELLIKYSPSYSKPENIISFYKEVPSNDLSLEMSKKSKGISLSISYEIADKLRKSRLILTKEIISSCIIIANNILYKRKIEDADLTVNFILERLDFDLFP